MKVPFSPPYIDEDTISEVIACLNSGWITTGPRVKELEELSAKLVGVTNAVAVNSWSSGASLVLKWLGIGPGDEVIIPAYTYAATALAVIHTGAKCVIVDVKEDFNIDPQKIAEAVTRRTKAVIAVDFGGWPCDYDHIMDFLHQEEVRSHFVGSTVNQRLLGRIALIADAAHSIGSTYRGRPAALASDVTIFSFHAVKNVTTAEGGMICLNLPKPFDNQLVYNWMRINSINGQTKDALSKTMSSDWRYDVVCAGLKINMPDVLAAIGLAQLRKYPHFILVARKRIYEHYLSYFSKFQWAKLQPCETASKSGSCHLFPLRINGFTEAQRDRLISKLYELGISLNVHFQPLPLLTLFREMGYKLADVPVALSNYVCEVSLPIYPQLSEEHCVFIEESVFSQYLIISNDSRS